MTTSRQSFLSDVLNVERIPVGKIAYFRGRLTNRIHALILTEFERLSREGQISKARIAKRIGRKPEQVTRWLGSPGNWTIETLSDLSLAMGYEPAVSLQSLYPSRQISSSAIDTRDNVYLFPLQPGNSAPLKPSPDLRVSVHG